MSMMSLRTYGILLVLLATILWSTAGLFARMLHLDVWTILGWRSFFGGLALFAIMAFQRARESERVGPRLGIAGIIAVPIAAVSMLSYIAALKLTTVANVLAMYATIPFVAAGIAYLWMGERPDRRVVIASAIAFVGVVVVAGFSARVEDLAGNAFAFLMTASFAVLLVMSRRYPSIAMADVNAFSSVVCVIVCLPLMATTLPSVHDLVVLAVFGITSTALAYLLFLAGGRYIAPGEAGLIALLDVVMGPLWVWLAFNEVPATATMVGSGLILTAVFWYLWSSLRSGSASAATVGA